MSAFFVLQNEYYNIPQAQATIQNKLQYIVTLGNIGHQAPLYKLPLYFVQGLYWYMKYLHVKTTKCQLGLSYRKSVNVHVQQERCFVN